MRALRIAQLASFRGNIGDNANVVGTRRMLERHLRRPIEYTDLEYLEYEPDPRWGGRRFDADFVRIANEHDLLMIGGGGFWELAVDRSATGTPIDLSLETLDAIRVPVVFHGLGFDISAGVSPVRVERFRTFLSYVLAQDRMLASVRNDGSLANIHNVIGPEYAERIATIPDGGFFTEVTPCAHIELAAGRETLAINLAGDGLRTRYRETNPNDTNFQRFVAQLAEVVNRWLSENTDRQVVLVPHIPEDLYVLWRLMEKVGPPFVRKRMTVAPYIHGPEAHDYVFDLYRRCDCILGMRFHANVCGIAMNVPTFGLITHPQIANLYQELGLREFSVEACNPHAGETLWTLLQDLPGRRAEIQSRYAALLAGMRVEMQKFHLRIGKLVDVFYGSGPMTDKSACSLNPMGTQSVVESV